MELSEIFGRFRHFGFEIVSVDALQLFSNAFHHHFMLLDQRFPPELFRFDCDVEHLTAYVKEKVQELLPMVMSLTRM
jgi:hypothetical protein